ncbi:RHS repeat-associated core domain-containing protein [Pseudomonas syringae]|uniref:RHS repeat domain-containing protein n=1 Tax=Pseudomonas syringae TaxID=317 RepID=UPI002A750465|nr:RHS repeat-associated core domain-containing protein [Pseudomonas syringae]MDY2564329.1 RHS repeat-associated core domain-containing protein [Pseudomonas syringae]
MVSSAVHAHTPELIVCEGRGLVVRQVLLHRTEATEAAAMRVTRQRFDPAGRMIAATDPRLASANRSTVYSLGGNALATESVDAGWQRVLFGEAGQVLRDWDGRGTEKQLEYDLHLRPTRIIEHNRCAERFTYGQADAAAHNQCNQLVRHDDTAGSRLLADYGLLGVALCEERQFLQTPESPDWPLAEAERDALLEPVVLQTCWRFNALRDALAQTDAMGNTQASGMTVAGQLKAAELTLTNTAQPQTLVSAIHYDAFNQVEQETAENGVVSLYSYDQQDGRLTGLSAISADGTLLQQLNYSYDPVGNILLVNDASQPDRYCDNQLIEPISRFAYDTLYQLIEASGREVRNGASHGPALPGLQSLPTIDPCQVSNYTQSYSYDAAGNLLQMRHEGAHNFTRNMHVAPDSNRSLPDDDGDVDFATSFDANGNLLQLVRGQVMGWDVRNQLQHITTVQREDGSNDDERYVYDGRGQRCRKISTAQASSRTLINEVRYLPGLEIRTTADGEILHVITAQAGRNSVRVLHWEAGKPGAIANDQVRYSLGDHLGSSTLELDQQGGLISQESYYPFGGTAWWAAHSVVEAKYKTVRYSGKERDASGLYYYGFRYYAPWLQRWINPDPAGDVDGLNLYGYVRNSPITYYDRLGYMGKHALESPPSPARRKPITSNSYALENQDARPGVLWGDQEPFLGPAYTLPDRYLVSGLEERLAAADKNSGKATAVVATMFDHDSNLEDYPYTVESKHLQENDDFLNDYAPNEWIFRSNYKRSGSNDYHANDVVRYQYRTIAQKTNTHGVLPSVIKNSFVLNSDTLKKTSTIENKTPEMLQTFLQETPNGKRTQRVLDDFGMEALWVDRQGDSELPFADFIVAVRPKQQSYSQAGFY